MKIVEKNKSIGIEYKITTKQSLKVPKYKGSDYKVYWKYVNSKAESIYTGLDFPVKIEYTDITYNANGLLKEGQMSLSIKRTPELWSDFTKIVFCTEAEYKAANEQSSALYKALKEAKDTKK